MTERVQWCQELTLSEMLADPIVRAVMDADGVDLDELEAVLASVVVQAFSGKVDAGFPIENATNS